MDQTRTSDKVIPLSHNYFLIDRNNSSLAMARLPALPCLQILIGCYYYCLGEETHWIKELLLIGVTFLEVATI